MPRRVEPLQPAALSGLLKTPGRYFDGRGLQLRVLASLAAVWIFKFTSPVTGKEREMSLGPHPEIGLALARKKAVELREMLRQKIDPLADRDAKQFGRKLAAERALTVKEAALSYITGISAGRDPKTIENWRWSLGKHVFKHQELADTPMATADLDWMVKVLMMPQPPSGQPFWTSKNPTAKHVRERLEIVFRYAKKRGWRDGDNPARWENGLDDCLPAPETVHEPKHHADLHYSKIPEFMAWLSTRENNRLRYRPAQAGPYERRKRTVDGAATPPFQFVRGDCRLSCLVQLAVLTGVRISEARGARWDEIDDAARIWSIPKERMKGVKGQKRAHRVPLSGAALEVLGKMRKFRDDQLMPCRDNDRFVFPGDGPGRTIGRSSVWFFLYGKHHKNVPDGDAKERFGEMTTHGFRTGLDEWGEAAGYSETLRDRALAHVIGNKVKQAYGGRSRPESDQLERRRVMMEAWARFCTQPPGTADDGKIVPLRRSAR